MLGPTGRFPQGKANKHDEGELRFAAGVRDGVVVLDFGKSVAWFGMDPDAAITLGELLIKHGKSLKQ